MFGSSAKPSLTRDTLHQLTYLHANLSEVLRLYPLVPIDVKHVMEDDVLPDGNCVKKGNRLTYSMYSMGRMQSIRGPDCTSFRPERTCLGKDMAYFLMKAVASMLLLHFKVNLVPGHKVVSKVSITLYIRNGLLVTLEPHKTKLPE